MPGEILNFTLKHPQRNTSIKVRGRLVWKNETGFECITGVRFLDHEDSIKGKIFELISFDRGARVLTDSCQRSRRVDLRQKISVGPEVRSYIYSPSHPDDASGAEAKPVSGRASVGIKGRRGRVIAGVFFYVWVLILICMIALFSFNPDLGHLKSEALQLGSSIISRTGAIVSPLFGKGPHRGSVNNKPLHIDGGED